MFRVSKTLKGLCAAAIAAAFVVAPGVSDAKTKIRVQSVIPAKAD